MATTYGYGGEFSSDEDIDRIDANQQQSKFQDTTKPDRRQLEATIDTIRNMPPTSDVVLTDELLSGLLEYYKTQRGPIVDSTRALYKKIVLRLIRGEQPASTQPSNGDNLHKEATNGSSNNNNNNNTVEPIAPSAKQTTTNLASSDEDEPMPPAETFGGHSLDANKKKLDPRVVYSATENNVQPMELDTEAVRNAMMMRLSKQIDLSTTDDDDHSETEESSDEDDSHDSELLDVTPIKPVAISKNVTHASNLKTTTSGKSSTESVLKKRVTTSTPNKVITSEVKKPYTRSQRVTTRASSSAVVDKSASATRQAKEDSVVSGPVSSSPGVKNASTKRANGMKLALSAAIVVILALVLYNFRLDLKKSTENIIRGIKF